MRLRFTPLILLTACALGGRGSVAPGSFVHSTSDVQMSRTIDVRDGFTHAQAMRALTDALGAHFTIDVSDQRAGFVMTGWQAPTRDGVPDLGYRTRIIARFVGDDWRKLTVRSEANVAQGIEWDVGYDVAELESVTNDLRAKFSRR